MVMRSPGSAVRRLVTWLPGNREAVTTAATTTDPAAATMTPLLLGLLRRAGVAITAMELKLDMLRLPPPVLPLVLPLGSNRRLLVAKLRTDTEDTEATPILLAWGLRRPLPVCLRWLTAVLAALLPLHLLATNLLLPLPAISLPLPRPPREQFLFCQ
jgi:hypothetical protein